MRREHQHGPVLQLGMELEEIEAEVELLDLKSFNAVEPITGGGWVEVQVCSCGTRAGQRGELWLARM